MTSSICNLGSHLTCISGTCRNLQYKIITSIFIKFNIRSCHNRNGRCCYCISWSNTFKCTSTEITNTTQSCLNRINLLGIQCKSLYSFMPNKWSTRISKFNSCWILYIDQCNCSAVSIRCEWFITCYTRRRFRFYSRRCLTLIA